MSEASEDEASKFEDAQDAGTNGHLCTLILTDGGTGNEIASIGLSVLGRRQYGRYQLLQKDYEAPPKVPRKDVLDIPETVNLMRVVGLKYNVDYSNEDNFKTLRYGKLMILTDQNEEGSYFKGLLINFLYTNWRHLLFKPFLEEFITPVVKATKEKDTLHFFSFAEFEEWKVNRPDNRSYNIRYYRGIGTCTRIEVKEYFSNMNRHRVVFEYSGPDDDKNIAKAFSENELEQRKEWIIHHMEECRQRKAYKFQEKYLYTANTKSISFSEFINLEYILFADFDNKRSIPSVVDGFKPGQRKVLYTCFKRDDEYEIRVSQLSGAVSEVAAYLGSDVSLSTIIIEMAQNFVGSNNINLLIPSGQFGTRLMGGKDCAEYHYIYTKISTLARLIFHPDDDPLLSYKTDENETIEPEWYIPIIPMILVNGSEGVGTGWSTKIPKHDPHQIIRCLRKMIGGEDPEMLAPFYKTFRGTIEAVGDHRFSTKGIIAVIDSNKIEITELPVGTWTCLYVENVIKPLLYGNENMKPIISDYVEFHTDTTVRFVIDFAPEEFDKLEKEVGGFHRIFKLCGSISTDNMYAFDNNHYLKRYEKANDILKEFYHLRLEYYRKRKTYLESKLAAEADKLSNQLKFINEICNHSLVVENKPSKAVIDELILLGFKADPVEEWKRVIGIEVREECVESEQRLKEQIKDKNFDYLLDMSMRMLTEELKNDLVKQCDAKISELSELKNSSEYDLWLTDLAVLEKELSSVERKERLKESVSVKETYPSNNGKNVEFKVTEEFLEKYCKDFEEY